MAVSAHVAVAVIRRQHQVLIALRQPHQHQGGLWEFPGGKVEENETVLAALRREIREEVGLDIQSARPYLTHRHDYGDKIVLLDVWLVEHFLGEAQGREGQQLQWCEITALVDYAFPAANTRIIEQLQSEHT